MEVSDWWIVGAVALVLLFLLLYVRLGETTAVQFARAHLRRVRADAPESDLATLDEAAFVDHYLAVRRWRDPAYIAAFFVIAAGATIFALMMSTLVVRLSDPGPLVWQFMTFFGVIVSWVLSLVATLWLYQSRKTAALTFWMRLLKR